MKILFLAVICVIARAGAATYFVDGGNAQAKDKNPGTETAPWKSISRAAAAKELKPGDTVLIKTGVYRESVHLKVSGAENNPVTFAAAPGARVVIKGSEIISGKWERVTNGPALKGQKPGGFRSVWKVKLGNELFKDLDFERSYREKAKRRVSQVFMDDDKALQMIGPDPVYRNGEAQLAVVGQGIEDLVDNSFYFDAEDQTLYIMIGGEPYWFNIEAGVRGWVLTARDVHDVVIRGLEMRHNRQPAFQWPMISIAECNRVLMEQCKIYQADFCGLGLSRSTNCVLRKCDFSHNGNSGLSLALTLDCAVEDCWVMFNNYRGFHAEWHAGGMKCIPNNKRCTVRRCEAAYNITSDGIWFDSGNSDIRILDNVSHHNGGCGIFFESNAGGGLIANNLVYANGNRGIFISGSQKTWIVHNTVVANLAGIVCTPRGNDYPLEDIHALNNLLIANYVTQNTVTRGSDLTLWMEAKTKEDQRRSKSLQSDYNVYANTGWVPLLRNERSATNTLAYWQEHSHRDLHSRVLPVKFELMGTQFNLLTTEGLDVAGPLPPELNWKPPNPSRVGCSR